jgi:hypothetical protein
MNTVKEIQHWHLSADIHGSLAGAKVRMQALVQASLAHWARFRLAQGLAAFRHKVIKLLQYLDNDSLTPSKK